MNDVFDNLHAWNETAEEVVDIRPHIYIIDTILGHHFAPEKKKAPRGSAQPIEKAQNGQENQRKSKHFPLIF